MRRRLISIALGAALVVVPAVVSAQAAPPPAAATETKPLAESLTGMAKAEYVAARTLFEDGDFAGALVKYQSAYDASKDARLYWNFGACNKGMRKYAEAIRDLERFKNEGGALLGDKDRADADELIAALRPYVAAVSVSANESGATVVVDDRPIGQTPLSKFLLDLGSHRLVVKKAGFVDDARTIEITGTTELALETRLEAVKHVGHLIVHAGSSDLIALDGQIVGSTTYDAAIATGTHLLRVTNEKKKPYESHVVIDDDQTRSVDVSLESNGVPTWIWIVAGGAAVAALAVVGVVVFSGGSDDSSSTSRSIAGTMPPGVIQLPSFRSARR